MTNVDVIKENLSLIHFETLHESDFVTADLDPSSAAYSVNFDYQTLPEASYRLLFDLGLEMAFAAKLQLRVGFLIKLPNYGIDTIFRRDIVEPLLAQATVDLEKYFREKCADHSITLPPNLSKVVELVQPTAKNIVDTYFSFRKQNDMVNQRVHDAPGFGFSCSSHTYNMMIVVFNIIDQIVYTNKAFKRSHNLDQLTNFVPESSFNTLKFACLEVGDRDVVLSLYQSILLLQCLNCALQLLLGKYEDRLTHSLEEIGVDDKLRSEFFAFGTDLYKTMNDNLQETGAVIPNIEETIDWNSLIL